MRAQHFWGYPLYSPLDGKSSLSNASAAIKNHTFGADMKKNIY